MFRFPFRAVTPEQTLCRVHRARPTHRCRGRVSVVLKGAARRMLIQRTSIGLRIGICHIKMACGLPCLESLGWGKCRRIYPRA
jgi:hypothetical protein